MTGSFLLLLFWFVFLVEISLKETFFSWTCWFSSFDFSVSGCYFYYCSFICSLNLRKSSLEYLLSQLFTTSSKRFASLLFLKLVLLLPDLLILFVFSPVFSSSSSSLIFFEGLLWQETYYTYLELGIGKLLIADEKSLAISILFIFLGCLIAVRDLLWLIFWFGVGEVELL